jgi:S1-C subfamily serine protease
MASGSPVWISPQRGRTDLFVADRKVIDRAAEFHSIVTGGAGAAAADLFAQPVVDSAGRLTWIDRLGAQHTMALSELPASERASAETTLRTRLAEVERLRADPRYGDLITAALSVESPEAIKVADGRPIVAGWGAIAPNTNTTEALQRHYARTLGPYLSLTDPPILSEGTHEIALRPSAAPVDMWRASRAALIACLVAAACLLFLWLPGVLMRTASAVAVPSGPPRIVNNEDVNRALNEQIRALEGQLSGDVCTGPGAGPPHIEQIPATPHAVPGPSGRSQNVTPDRPAALTPPVEPDRTPVPPEANPGSAARPETLAKLLDQATVLIVTNHGLGSGFFVSPQFILTNRHVIEGNDGRILVGNHALGQMVSAEEIAVSSSTEPGQPDYALLKLKDDTSRTVLSMSDSFPEQLQNVIAAGYPQVVISTDANFQKLLNGDSHAIPEIALTDGTVVVVQNQDSATPVVLHRASISPGNSGGPLVDECGRAVGINTFVQTSQGAADRINYSLAARSAIQFLQQHGVNPTVVNGRCSATVANNAPADNAPANNAPAPANNQAPAPAPAPAPANNQAQAPSNNEAAAPPNNEAPPTPRDESPPTAPANKP